MTLSRYSDNPKRKLDDNGVDNNILHKMKRHEVDADHTSPSQQPFNPWRSDENSPQNRSFSDECSSSSSTESSTRSESTRLQLFVRMVSGGKTIVIQADKSDTVENLHKRIEVKTKIPVNEQRVIYKGKQLQDERSLSYYSIAQDSSLHLVGRMRSTDHPVACRVVDDIMYIVSLMHRGGGGENNNLPRGMSINEKLSSFFSTIPTEAGGDDESSYIESTEKYLTIFTNSSVPAALVMLYTSPLEANKSCGESSIKLFLNSCLALPEEQQGCCLPVVLEFCRLLRRVCPHNSLYGSCRNTLGSLLETVQELVDKSGIEFTSLHYRLLTVGEEILPCLSELADLMEQQLYEDNLGPSLYDVQKFSSFWRPLRYAIDFQLSSLIPFALPLRSTVLEAEVGRICQIFGRLLTTMHICMLRIESSLGGRGVANTEAVALKWGQYLNILKIVNSMSELYQGGKEKVVRFINSRKVPFCALILKFVKRGDDHGWISEYREATTFECRRHLAMMLFPDGKEDYSEMHEMLIDRSQVLKESYVYISQASPAGLHGALFMEFKNEEATGPGVLREWFHLVCQEIFSPGGTLFLRSADDFRRFSPNPASKVDPLHLEYFKFAGRVIALALMHKVQVGVLFDRVFYLQLTNQTISLEDIKDTDRVIYNSGVTCDDHSLVVSLSIPKKKLSGHLPSSLGSLSNLRHLNLRSNDLTGTLPLELFRAQRLQSLVLYGNSLSGSIPKEVGDLKLLQSLDLSRNGLDGPIPDSILECKRLRSLGLSQNNLTGSVPSGFGRALGLLQKLDLSYNNFTGLIPHDLGNLSRLQGTLDLSHNSFSGSIPASLGSLPEKVYVDLAHNNLSGPIPQTGALVNRGPTAFLGNPRLCGPPLKDPCLPEDSPTSHPFVPEGASKKGGLSKSAVIAIVVCDVIGICIVGFLFSCCYLKLCSRNNTVDEEGHVLEKECKEKKGGSSFCFRRDGSESPSSENLETQHDLVLLDKHMALDLDELLKASAFVLGKGGNGIVYKVVLEDGVTVAVRRLGEGGSQRCKEFQTEVEAIGKLRHPNIVSLKAYYWSVEEKLLIYDYIPNGSLTNALHGNPSMVSFKPLAWDVRLKIMRGIARGLLYLHEFSPKKYVHGSLKLSNILLGQDMEPHISDFGLMHLSSIAGTLETNTNDHPPSNKSASSIGPLANLSSFYQAPEAMKATVKPSQKWDVYSFGVILLEMITGRLPIVFVGKMEMEIVKWIQMCIDEKKEMSDILDPYLVPEDTEIEEEVIAVLKVAMACVSISPEKRPAMKHVADALNQIFLQ